MTALQPFLCMPPRQLYWIYGRYKVVSTWTSWMGHHITNAIPMKTFYEKKWLWLCIKSIRFWLKLSSSSFRTDNISNGMNESNRSHFTVDKIIHLSTHHYLRRVNLISILFRFKWSFDLLCSRSGIEQNRLRNYSVNFTQYVNVTMEITISASASMGVTAVRFSLGWCSVQTSLLTVDKTLVQSRRANKSSIQFCRQFSRQVIVFNAVSQLT